MKNYRDDEGIGPHDSDRRLLEEDEDYANMKTNEENMKEALELTVNKHTFPQLCNHSVPKYMYTQMSKQSEGSLSWLHDYRPNIQTDGDILQNRCRRCKK